MYGSLVYSNTAITSASGVVNFGHHTSAVFILNLDATNDAVIKLNNQYLLNIPHTPNQATRAYVKIPGDYTEMQVITANITVSVFAIG